MTLSLPRPANIGAIGLALTWTALSFGTAIAPAPAQAASSGAFYTAELVQPTEESRMVAGGVAWACEGTKCTGTKGTSRPMRMCRELQRKVGEVASFTAKGKELDADKLARCNG